MGTKCSVMINGKHKKTQKNQRATHMRQAATAVPHCPLLHCPLPQIQRSLSETTESVGRPAIHNGNWEGGFKH